MANRRLAKAIKRMKLETPSEETTAFIAALEARQATLDDHLTEAELSALMKEIFLTSLDDMEELRGADEALVKEVKAEAEASVEALIEGFLDDPEEKEPSKADLKTLKKAVSIVSDYLEKQGWNQKPIASKPDLAKWAFQLQLGGHAFYVGIRLFAKPLECIVLAAFPDDIDKTYSLLISREIVRLNKTLSHGSFSYDEETGEATLTYAIPMTHGLYPDDFKHQFEYVTETFAMEFEDLQKHISANYETKEKETLRQELEKLSEHLN